MARDEKYVDLPAEFERMLRDTMTVEPSPAFLPRVRQRVAVEQVAPRWSWRYLALPVATAAVLVVALMPRGADDVSVRPPEIQAPTVMAGLPDLPPLSAALPSPVTPAGPRQPARLPVAARTIEREPGFGDPPAVVVDERQRRALYGLMQLVANGRLPEDAFAENGGASLVPLANGVVEIAVLPMQVSPIDVGGVMQSGTKAKQPPRPAEAGFQP
jgi:hypothetical protein